MLDYPRILSDRIAAASRLTGLFTLSLTRTTLGLGLRKERRGLLSEGDPGEEGWGAIYRRGGETGKTSGIGGRVATFNNVFFYPPKTLADSKGTLLPSTCIFLQKCIYFFSLLHQFHFGEIKF